VPIIVVVHLKPDSKSLLPELFAHRIALRVIEAEDKMPLESGTVYFAPPDYHLLLERDGSIALNSDVPVGFSRPSIDVSFEAAAWAYGEKVVGLLLSGANDDGARGLRCIHDHGGEAWVQDPGQAESKFMPESALREVPAARILGVSGILTALSGLRIDIPAQTK
jgi:two-component system chemotaxis response regulator CheB